jgi:hypothetical protein
MKILLWLEWCDKFSVISVLELPSSDKILNI